jgi:holo-[acyl-carrier protein] synthase
MILGIGNDLTDMRRIEKAISRFGGRFIRRCFTDEEIARAESRREAGTHIATYARRFAAKEACAKALGTGIAQGVFLRDIGVVNDELGRPALCLTGGAASRLASLTPPGKTARIHLAITDEPPLAAAQVMIEGV